jgi:hypothetical protein
MAIGRLPIVRAVAVAYQDLLRTSQALGRLFLLALLIVLIIHVSHLVLPHGGAATGLAIPIWVLRSLLLTPFLIAVHRFVLVDDIAGYYAIEPHNPRFWRFFVWSLVLTFLLLGPSLLLLSSALPLGLPATIAFICVTVSLIVAIIVCLRLAILFPAIAIDAPGATASNALADTRGFAVDIFLIYLLAALPIVAIDFVLLGLNLPTMIGTVIDGILDVIELVLLVVITSRVFQALGDRTLRPASG